MATFIIRVQLTKEITSKYTLLRDKLLAIGFTKRIKTKAGIEYRLPNGNYLIKSDQSLNRVFQIVQEVALKVDHNPMILVTEAVEGGNSWSGLEKC